MQLNQLNIIKIYKRQFSKMLKCFCNFCLVLLKERFDCVYENIYYYNNNLLSGFFINLITRIPFRRNISLKIISDIFLVG